MHVLIIDDEAYVRRLMGMVLEQAGYHTIQAPSAEQALKLLETYSPDIITVDLMMPGMSGLEFLQVKQQDERLRAIPCLVVTSAGIRSDLDQALNLGAIGTLFKPFSQRQLIESIRRAIRA
jgi:two-component system, OmpR family, phosphate regulon response regulator PhoB